VLNIDALSVMIVNQFHQSRSGSTPIPRCDDKRTKFINRAKGKIVNFNCCLSVHVDNYTIIVPKNALVLLKAQDIAICTFCLCILSPYMFQPTWAIFRGRNASV
jgi:hypothetical protein